MKCLCKFANSDDPLSFASKSRASRLLAFSALLASLPKPVRILDIGGRTAFWENCGLAGLSDVEICSLNILPETQMHKNIVPVVGDAIDLSRFPDRSFTIAFSNSVIEHLQTFENQRRMASEMRRVAQILWLQTPNFWFPVEPHFLVPAWHWLPTALRVSIVSHVRCGWRGPYPDRSLARDAVNEIRLMTRVELQRLFPNSTLVPERFLGFVKSWTVVCA